MKHESDSQELEAKEFLKKSLTTVTQIEEKALNALINLFELVTYKKNEIIIQEGKISNQFYYIFKGIVKVYFYKNDKMVIDRFEIENGFFGGNFTHITKKPSTHIFEAVEDVALLRIEYEALDKLCRKYHDIERLYRLNMELYHASYIERLSIFKSSSTEDRYYNFINEYGDLANRVSLKDIANYLDMTPETLSRIRAARFDKNQKA